MVITGDGLVWFGLVCVSDECLASRMNSMLHGRYDSYPLTPDVMIVTVLLVDRMDLVAWSS